MAFENAQKTLIVPAGATSGRRIVINGETGEIEGYNANDFRTLSINDQDIILSDPSGSWVGLRADAGSALIMSSPPDPGPSLPFFVAQAAIRSAIGGAPDYRPATHMWSPKVVKGGGSREAMITLQGQGVNTIDTQIDLDADELTHNGRSVGRGPVGTFFWNEGTIAGTTTGTGVLPRWTSGSDTGMIWEANRLYKINGVISFWVNSNNGAEVNVTVRRTINDPNSQPLALWRPQSIQGVGANVPNFYFEAYVANKTNNHIFASPPGLTLSRAVSDGSTISLYGDATGCRLALIIEDIGHINDPGRVGLTNYAIGVV